MKLSAAVMVAAGGLGVCLVGVSVQSALWLEAANLQYPGSMVAAGAGPEQTAARRSNDLSWQRTYLAQDEVESVRNWYGDRLAAQPGSPLNPGVVDGCAWVSQVRSMLVVTHTVSVLACEGPAGTRVAVTESVRLGP